MVFQLFDTLTESSWNSVSYKRQLSNRNGRSALMPTQFFKKRRQAIVLAIDSGMSVTEAADKFQVAVYLGLIVEGG